MPNLTYITPGFIVTSLKASVEFYTTKLGFQVLYTGPEGDEYWAMLGRDNISIMLKAVAPDIKAIPNRPRHEWAPWDAYITTTDPDTLFEEYSAAGVPFARPLKVDTDNLRGFEVSDPDGYVLFFGKREVG